LSFGFLPPQQFGGQLVVAFAEKIRPYIKGFAGNPLDRMTAAVDPRIDVLDQESRSGRVARRRLRMVRNGSSSMTGGGRRLHASVPYSLREKRPFDNRFNSLGFPGGTE
jgi:hypothetical protein